MVVTGSCPHGDEVHWQSQALFTLQYKHLPHRKCRLFILKHACKTTQSFSSRDTFLACEGLQNERRAIPVIVKERIRLNTSDYCTVKEEVTMKSTDWLQAASRQSIA